MGARLNRLMSDYERIQKDFFNNPYIKVTPIGPEPPEKYHVTYLVDGIFLQPDGKIQVQKRHEVEITLTSEYPRYKPVCRILTPIWHPNFKDGQICIGDIWGAGESLSDIIINIGNMIQYKSWNSSSPLSADAAAWALENKQLFPVGKIDLYTPDNNPAERMMYPAADRAEYHPALRTEENDFVITAEELEGVTFVPSAQRMQQVSSRMAAKGGVVNFKTVLVKGLLWAFLGAILGLIFSEVSDGLISEADISRMMGYTDVSRYYSYNELAEDSFEEFHGEYEKYCKANGYDSDSADYVLQWAENSASSSALEAIEDYLSYDEKANDALENAYKYDFGSDDDELGAFIAKIARIHTGLWSGVIALFIGLLMGIGEGIFYGSKNKALIYGAIGAGVALVMGIISGNLAQWMYASWLPDDPSDFVSSLVRGVGWGIMGLGVGAAIGLIKPEKRRILFCSLGGIVGAFIGGFIFNYIMKFVSNDIVARAIGIIVMGALIGIGVGLLEQFAKSAWLKVVRGEFEGKEFLVFAGTTSIGNNGSNMIVLFKDKLVEEHHCDIVQDGGKYLIVNRSKQMGTLVNGNPVEKQYLQHGDSITVGNSVLVFNTK